MSRPNVQVGRGCIVARRAVGRDIVVNTMPRPIVRPDYRFATTDQTAAYRQKLIAEGLLRVDH